MRYAILANTRRGADLYLRVKSILGSSADVFVKKGKSFEKGIFEYDRLSDIVGDAFHQYDGLVFIMSAGITVRMIAPHIVSKLQDPAVVVIDERGKHVISLLSGHVGGANNLTRLIASRLAADPVITTATDVNNILAPDYLAAEWGLKPWPKKNIEIINSALLDGNSVDYYVDRNMDRADYYSQLLLNRGIGFKLASIEEINSADGYKAIITASEGAPMDKSLYLKPRKLVAGIGCRRGTSAEEIYNALEMACRIVGRPVDSIDQFTSTVVKSDEAGLLQMAADAGKAIAFYENADIQQKIDEYGLKESDFVKEQVGVGNICEATALCYVGKGQIILSKMKFGKVTVALVWEK